MDPLPDPYTPGQVPRVLAGRTAETGRIRDQLGRVATFGEVGGPMLVFHAPRGLGKTSLLRNAEREAEERGFVSAWVSCTRRQPVLADLVRAVDRGMQRAEVIPARDREGWRLRLDRIGLELGVPGLKVTGELATESSAPAPAGGPASVVALEDLLHDSARRVRDRGGAGLVVFVDELHAATETDMAILLNTWQNLDGRREDNPLALITAGLPVTPEAMTRAATFGERSTFVALDVLAADDARAALLEPARRLEVSWEEAAVECVLGAARGYPYFLQLLGSATWRAGRPVPGHTISADDVRRGEPLAEEQLTAMYRARLGAATRGEQAFLRAMAGEETPSGNVTRAAIAAALGTESRSISVPRERLIEKGVIEPVGHGLVRFTVPGFGQWLRELDDR